MSLPIASSHSYAFHVIVMLNILALSGSLVDMYVLSSSICERVYMKNIYILVKYDKYSHPINTHINQLCTRHADRTDGRNKDEKKTK